MEGNYVLHVSIFLLGFGLVLNPLYLYPDGGGDSEVTYYVDTIENETAAEAAIQSSEQVLHCPGERPCALETRVLENGAVEYDGVVDDYREDPRVDHPPWYPVVRIEGEVYLPESEYRGNRTILTLSDISYMEAVEHTAVDSAERSEEVREAAETGSVTVHGEQIEDFERNRIIEHEGEYYWTYRYKKSGGHWTNDGHLAAVRSVLFALGSGLLVYTGWNVRNTTD